MPGIFRLSCDSCDLSALVSESQTYVRTAADDLALVGHPGERRQAERITGERWDALVSNDRIEVRHAAVCSACGRTDFYALEKNPRASFLRRITSRPPAERVASVACVGCGKHALIPIYETKRVTAPCQHCDCGTLRSTVHGMS